MENKKEGKEHKNKTSLASHMETHKEDEDGQEIESPNLFFSPQENQLISNLFEEVSFKGKDTAIASSMKTLIDSGWPNPGTKELKTIAGILGSTAVPFSQVEIAVNIKQKLRNALDFDVSNN